MILITGCCGFIGSHLSERLLNENNIVIGIDNMNDYYSPDIKKDNLDILNKYPNFTFYQEDIVDTKLIQILKPDIVIHLAGMAGVRYSLENPTLYMKNNVEGMTNLLEQSKDVNLFVYASSSSVYGLNTKVPFSENDEINNPNSPYAVSKICMEKIAKLYQDLYKIKTVGLRFFTVYGPRGRPDMAPYKFLNNIMNEKEIDKYGNGETYRDYTFISDIIDGIMGLLKNKDNLNNNIYNLGNSDPITLNEFIRTCEEVTNKKAIINQMENQRGDVPKTYSDISRAKNDFGYSPKINIKKGLKITYESIHK